MWASLLLIVAAVVLPYSAVLFANAGRERRDTDGTFMTPREIGPGTGAPRGLRRRSPDRRAGRSHVSLFGPVPDAVDELVCSSRGCRGRGDLGPALEQPEAAHPGPAQGVAGVRRAPRAPEPVPRRARVPAERRPRGGSRVRAPVMSPAARRADGAGPRRRRPRGRLHVPRPLAVGPARVARRRDRRGGDQLVGRPGAARHGPADPGRTAHGRRRVAARDRRRALRDRRHRPAAQPARQRHPGVPRAGAVRRRGRVRRDRRRPDAGGHGARRRPGLGPAGRGRQRRRHPAGRAGGHDHAHRAAAPRRAGVEPRRPRGPGPGDLRRAGARGRRRRGRRPTRPTSR